MSDLPFYGTLYDSTSRRLALCLAYGFFINPVRGIGRR